jgi:hypothetical protein
MRPRLSRVKWLETAFELVIGFTGLLKYANTINYSATANSRTNSLQYALSLLSLPCLHSRCLVTAFNAVHSSASLFTSLLATATPGHWLPSRVWPPLATIRYHRLPIISDSELSESSNYFSLENLDTDRLENTASNSSSIVACVSVAAVTWLGCRGNVFTGTLPRNDRLFWLRNPGFERTCHNTKSCNRISDSPTEIRTGYLPNTSLERFRPVNLLDNYHEKDVWTYIIERTNNWRYSYYLETVTCKMFHPG